MSSPSVFDAYRRQVASTRQMADAVFESADQLERLLMDSMRRSYTEQMDFLQALAAARDPQEAGMLYANYCSHMPDQLLRAHQELLRIASVAQVELGRVVERHIHTLAAGGNGAAAQADGEPMAAMRSFWDQRFKEAAAAADLWLRVTSGPATDEGDARPARDAAQPARRRTKA
jgi:hypothetical protein